MAESLGGALGALLWVIAGSTVVEWMAGMFRLESERDRAYRILGAYVGVWAVLALLPLDFTVRLEELSEKFRAGRDCLGAIPRGWTLRDAGGTIADGDSGGRLRRRAGAQTAIACVRLRRGWPSASHCSWRRKLAQAFSYSRTADTTDLLMNATGVVLGVALATRWLDASDPSFTRTHASRFGPSLGSQCGAWRSLIRHWSPFDFTTDTSMIRSRLPAMFGVPFLSYYSGFAPSVLVDATTKLLMAVPVGALLQLMWLPGRSLSHAGR